MRFSTRHEFACTPETFFSEAVYFDPQYHDGLYRELRFRSWEVVEHREEDGRVHEVRIKKPERDLPAAVRKALGVEAIEYREEVSYDRRSLSYTFRVIPNVLPGKIRIEGCYHLFPAGEGRCVREVEMEIEVKVFGVGSLVERHLAEDLRHSYDVAAAFTRRWIAERLPQAPPQPAGSR